MSSVYSSEPPTSGKVILITNYGNIDVELWTKEAPRACRNFLQLCMEGYYNNCIFFRIIKGFMIQTGDPSNTGKEGESIWGKEFQDELHSRLKFNHRGILAMANRNLPNTNSSQFFITMDKCPWLDKKHTIFGKVTGQSIFNALAIGDLPTREDYPDIDTLPMIVKIEIVLNPFQDIIPRNKTKQIKNTLNESEIKRSLVTYDRQQKMKDNNLISFDDAGDICLDLNENALQLESFRIKPIHEIIKNDKKLINKPVVNNIDNLGEYKLSNLKKRISKIQREISESDSSSSESESDDIKNQKILNEDIQNLANFENERKSEIIKLKQDIKNIKKRLDNPNEEQEENPEKPMTALQRHQSKFLNIKKKRDYTVETIQKIDKFKEKLKSNKSDGKNWMSNKLKFHVDSAKAYQINETNEKMKKNMNF